MGPGHPRRGRPEGLIASGAERRREEDERASLTIETLTNIQYEVESLV